jgi:integrase
MAQSRWIKPPIFNALLLLMQPENAEALRISMDYGLRIGDVLKMPTEALRKPYWSFKESKTGKRRRVRLSQTHKDVLWTFAGKNFVFEHRLDQNKHRTRQTVYKDIKRLANALGYKGISPHSARKIYAVSAYHKCGDLTKVQKWLNHSDPAVTALYALADEMQKKPPKRNSHSSLA